MSDITTIINSLVELEGQLRVLRDRDSAEARALLTGKYAAFRDEMEQFLAPVADAHLPEVKTGEAEDSEVVDETDAATAAIERGESREDPPAPVVEAEPEPEPEPDPAAPYRPVAQHFRNTALLKAFTLNDKFRYIRDIFGGEEAEFTDTLDILADMDSFAEARDYIVHDMMLDPDNDSVAALLETVRRYMPR